jgi:glycosyltransferase involved in cell wall biosynthesis
LGPAAPARRRASRAPERPVVRYAVKQVPVTLLLTRHNDEKRPDRGEARQYLALLDSLLTGFAPDVLIAANGHPMIFEAMRDARRRGITTAFAVRGFGYYDRAYFADVDHVFTCSRFLTGVYEEKIGLRSTPLEPPLDWSAVIAPTESRAFVTFVNPSPHKGLFLFARLADMLGARRPDIPMLVVQSGQSAGGLNDIPGIDFSRYPQLMAAPPVRTPAEYFALTRILLVPSVWEEPFGRVAAEAMVNGVPPIVSDRGALPDVVGGDADSGGGGLVRAVPEWMTPTGTRIPSEQDLEPWYAAVCGLWDDPPRYEAIAGRAQTIAHGRYSEDVSRARHVEYFTSLDDDAMPFDPHTTTT